MCYSNRISLWVSVDIHLEGPKLILHIPKYAFRMDIRNSVPFSGRKRKLARPGKEQMP